MNKSPLVSILIAAYNAERYIKESLDSAFSQTYPNIEVVVVDDGSTDKTKAIALSYKDPRLRYLYKSNEGILKTRNRLLKETRGDLLTFLDSDDIYLPDKISQEVQFLIEHPDFAAVYCDLRYFYDGEPTKLYRHQYVFHSGDIFEPLLEKMFITNTTLMLRRSVLDTIGFYDESVGMVEDWDYFLRMARAGLKFGFIPKDLVRFRLRWDNNTRFDNQVKIQSSAVNIFEKLKKSMSLEEQKKYSMGKILKPRKLRLGLMYLCVGERKKSFTPFFNCDPSIFWRLSVLLVFPFLTLIPSSLMRSIVEKAWNAKKRNLFIPVD